MKEIYKDIEIVIEKRRERERKKGKNLYVYYRYIIRKKIIKK